MGGKIKKEQTKSSNSQARNKLSKIKSLWLALNDKSIQKKKQISNTLSFSRTTVICISLKDPSKVTIENRENIEEIHKALQWRKVEVNLVDFRCKINELGNNLV